MVRRIDFKEDAFLESYILNGKPISALHSTSKINFFVGANNSGKSRFMRFLLTKIHNYKGPNLAGMTSGNFATNSNSDISIKGMPAEDLSKLLLPVTSKISGYVPRLNWSELMKIASGRDYFSEYDLIEVATEFERTINTLNTVDKANAQLHRLDIIAQRNLFLKAIYDFIEPIEKLSCLTTYVPSFRTLRKFLEPIEETKKNPYSAVTYSGFRKITEPILQYRNLVDYFQVVHENEAGDFFSDWHTKYSHTLDFNSIFSGETLFEKINELRNSGEEKRLLLTGFEDFLSKYFFNGARVQLNALTHDGVEDIFVKIGSEKEFPIYNLGDGIQSIILLTFPLFYNKKHPNYFIFYEEPELYLHPGMQRIFVEVLRSFGNVQAFIVTHSNHILDTSLDFKDYISIYSFEKKLQGNLPVFDIEMLSSPDISLLNLLGVRNSSIFLSNCCLWVEGISDRLYIKKFLELYATRQNDTPVEAFFEDLHFSFLEFGGNQIAHYNFGRVKDQLKIQAKKITNRILLVHDMDSNKSKRHTLLRKELGENYLQLSVLEIENLLPPEILKSTLMALRANKDEELSFNEFDHSDYKGRPIADFIQSCIKSGKIKKIISRKSKSSTPKILNKADFALIAIAQMNDWQQIGKLAQELTVKIHGFIASHNLHNKPVR